MNRTEPTLVGETKTHLSVLTAINNPAHVPVTAAVKDFDAAAVHHKEIAQVAYRIWLERAYCPGSPEEDWQKAVNEVRARYNGTALKPQDQGEATGSNKANPSPQSATNCVLPKEGLNKFAEDFQNLTLAVKPRAEMNESDDLMPDLVATLASLERRP